MLIYAACIASVKISILLFYRGIFNLFNPRFRFCWYANLSVVIAHFFALCLELSFQYEPISLMWAQGSVNYVDHLALMVFGSLNAAIDLSILLLPIPMTWQMKMEKRQKITVTGILGLGLL